MANRCDGAFAGMSETEVEIQESEISDDTLRVSVTVKRLCDNCGESAAESEQETEITIAHDCDHETLVARAKDAGISEGALGLDEAGPDQMAFLRLAPARLH